MLIQKLAQYQAYSAASQTVPKVRQVVMLYDAAIRNMKQVKEAIAERQIERRFNLLTKTSEIINALQGCLDFENGGEVATLLFDFYASLDARVLSVHRSNSVETCDQVIAEMKQMRDAWEAIDKASEQNTPATGSDASVSGDASTPSGVQLSV